MDKQPRFMKLGLTNSQSVDLGDYCKQVSKKNLAGFCCSFKCCNEVVKNKKGYTNYKLKPRVEKTKDPAVDVCPDCNSILVWREISSKRHVVADKE